MNDRGSCSFILEDETGLSRIINSHLVPSNQSDNTWNWNDPYRWELFAIYSGLLTIHDLENRFHVIFKSITISVDNDAALNSAVSYCRPPSPSDAHYDIIGAIRNLKKLIKTPYHKNESLVILTHKNLAELLLGLKV